MAEYLRNVWYAAAFSDEVSESPLARTLLEREMVLFRRADGALAMLEDRCPHRFAPLSLGKVIGNDIQCPYHGLQFDGSGACTRNPHHKTPGPLKAASVASFPVMERYGVIWFWPGDPERADPEVLPKIGFLEEPDRYGIVKGKLNVKGNYLLVVDNLLDLSHASYIHPQFGSGAFSAEEMLAKTTSRLERRENSLVNHRLRTGFPAPIPSQRLFGQSPTAPTHTRSTMTWYPPAILDFDAGSWEIDAAEESGAHIPQLHAITPETEFSAHYFFINGRNRRLGEAEVDEALLAMFDSAFHQQDEPMIEAVQRRMGQVSDIHALDPVLLSSDAAPVTARRMLTAMIEKERGAQPALMPAD